MKTKEEIREIVCEEIENKKYSKKVDIFIIFSISFFVIYCVLAICQTYKYNAEHESYDKELEFCKSIYESDKVILEQCEHYFVILGEEND